MSEAETELDEDDPNRAWRPPPSARWSIICAKRTDVQNIDLMNLSGFCRNCLSKWYRAAAEERGHDLTYEDAREIVYGMPYARMEGHLSDRGDAGAERPAFERGAKGRPLAQNPTGRWCRRGLSLGGGAHAEISATSAAERSKSLVNFLIVMICRTFL